LTFRFVQSRIISSYRGINNVHQAKVKPTFRSNLTKSLNEIICTMQVSTLCSSASEVTRLNCYILEFKAEPDYVSFFIKAPAASAKPKRSGRKSEPSKEPKPEPVAEVVDAITPVPYAAKAKVAKSKSARKSAVAKVGRSQKAKRTKRSELELVSLLRKADIQV
jgi:hypothetical protein